MDGRERRMGVSLGLEVEEEGKKKRKWKKMGEMEKKEKKKGAMFQKCERREVLTFELTQPMVRFLTIGA